MLKFIPNDVGVSNHALLFGIAPIPFMHLSLFEEDYHRISNVQANVAPIIMCYRVTTFFNNKTVPVAFVPPIKLFFDLAGDITEMTLIVILKRLKTGDDRCLLFISRHVCSFDQYFSVSISTKGV